MGVNCSKCKTVSLDSDIVFDINREEGTSLNKGDITNRVNSEKLDKSKNVESASQKEIRESGSSPRYKSLEINENLERGEIEDKDIITDNRQKLEIEDIISMNICNKKEVREEHKEILDNININHNNDNYNIEDHDIENNENELREVNTVNILNTEFNKINPSQEKEIEIKKSIEIKENFEIINNNLNNEILNSNLETLNENSNFNILHEEEEEDKNIIINNVHVNHGTTQNKDEASDSNYTLKNNINDNHTFSNANEPKNLHYQPKKYLEMQSNQEINLNLNSLERRRTNQSIIADYLKQKNDMLDIEHNTEEFLIDNSHLNFNTNEPIVSEEFYAITNNKDEDKDKNNITNDKNYVTNTNANNQLLTCASKKNENETHLETEAFHSFNFEKLVHNTESFFIRNSYDSNQYKKNEMQIDIPDNMDLDQHFETRSIVSDVSSNVGSGKIKRVIKTIVKKVVTKKILVNLKNREEMINSQIKKSIAMHELVSNTYKQLNNVLIKSYFEIWKDLTKDNFILLKQNKQDGDKKIRENKLKKIFNKRAQNNLTNVFYKWCKTVLITKNYNIMGAKILKKLFMFKEKLNIDKYFRKFSHNTKVLNDQEFLIKIKQSFLKKIINIKLKNNNYNVVEEIFELWKDKTFEVKDEKKQIASMKIVKWLKTINYKEVIRTLSAIAEEKLSFIQKSELISILMYLHRQKNETNILNATFSLWKEQTNFDNMEPFQVLKIDYDNLPPSEKDLQILSSFIIFKKIIQKQNLKKFFSNLKRKMDWEYPKINKMVKVRYTNFFLKSGEVLQEVRRVFKPRNALWRAAKPLKYYFMKFAFRSEKLKEKELQAKSNKWQFEDRFEVLEKISLVSARASSRSTVSAREDWKNKINAMKFI